MVAPVITALPTAPDIADPANFATDASVFVAALAPLQSEINAFGTYLNLGENILGRNLVINPVMAVAQRADRAPSGYTVPFYAGPDRWLVARSGTGTTGFSRIANTDFGGTYAAQATYTLASTESWNVQQRIESANIAHLAGQEVTLSFYVSGSSTVGSSTMFAALNYANAVDNFSTDTEIANFSVAYTGTATQFTFTFTLPASAVNGVSVVLRGVKTTSTGAFTLTFGGVQLEAGPVATILERRSYGQELSSCMRYYEAGQHYRSGAIATGTSGPETSAFSVTKRAGVTMAITPTALVNFTGVTLFGFSISHFTHYPTGGTSGGQGRYAINWTADGEL